MRASAFSLLPGWFCKYFRSLDIQVPGLLLVAYFRLLTACTVISWLNGRIENLGQVDWSGKALI